MKKLMITLMVTIIAVAFTSAGTPVSAAEPCNIIWGSLSKHAGPDYSPNVLTNVRTGQHPCWDRIVFDLNGVSAAGYDVRYVDNVRADGSGAVIPLAGGAKLNIVIKAAAYNAQGQPTYGGKVGERLPKVNLGGYQTFREAKFAGSFEGVTTIGLGVRNNLPFKAYKLDNRVVVDVAHRW